MLLILAGVTINIVLSEGGIIAKANQAKEKQEIGQLKDQINSNVVDWYADKILNDNVTIDDLWNKLIQDKIIADAKTDIEGPDANGVYLITTNKGYAIEVIIDEKGNVTIGEGGKRDELPPRIVEFKSTSKTTSSIVVKAEVTRIENGGKLSYYYKKSSETEYKALKENTTDKTADYTGLTQNIAYDLKLVVKNKNGSVEKTISVLTEEFASGTISQKGPTVWSNEKASIELQTTDTENTMQYQKNNITGSWTNYTTAITGLAHGDIVYVRMFDGVNGSSPFSLNITDDVKPQTATISLNSITTNIDTPITATITQIDNESGVDITKSKWVYNITATAIGTNEASYTGGTFSSNPQTISLNTSATGTYYLHVLTTDVAGNKKETISDAIRVESYYEKVKIGDYINYNVENYAGKWRILYIPNDLGTENSGNIQIISDTNVRKIYLKSSSYSEARNIYNNVVDTLNNYAKDYINSNYVERARCVGSNPDNPKDISEYYRTTLEVYNPYSITLKDTDENYKIDLEQMKKAGINISDDSYWMASRRVVENSANLFTIVHMVNKSGEIHGTAPSFTFVVGTNGSYPGEAKSILDANYGLRPVIYLKNDIKIISGDGSEEKPWNISI